MAANPPTKKYDTILIDTSIFDSNGLCLETGLLGALKQFKESPIDILIPDVLRNEIQSHLESKTRSSRSAFEKAINDAGNYLLIDEQDVVNAKQLLPASEDISKLANSRIARFIRDTGAQQIDCDDYVSIGTVLDRYFANQPPFSETGKKNEFPDAIVLLAVDEWAKKNGRSILAISQDKDWKQYCENSARISYEKSLSQGIAEFNDAKLAVQFVNKLEKLLEEGKAQSFIDLVASGLESSLSGFTPGQDAESQFNWEPEGSHGWFENFTFLDDKFRIIEAGEDWIYLEGRAEIEVGAEGEFSLSVLDSVDKDYVSLGSATVKAKEDFVSPILITVLGDMEGDIEALEIDGVEVVEVIGTMHFGILELDYSDYD